MFTITGTDIRITRGDTATMRVTTMIDGKPYTFTEQDVVVLTVRHTSRPKPGDWEFQQLGALTEDGLSFAILPENTQGMVVSSGGYFYDIQLTMGGDLQRVYTLVVGNFIVTREATY